jgi:uncharacterized protein (DUF302 family)
MSEGAHNTEAAARRRACSVPGGDPGRHPGDDERDHEGDQLAHSDPSASAGQSHNIGEMRQNLSVGRRACQIKVESKSKAMPLSDGRYAANLGAAMQDNPQSSDSVVTKVSSTSVAETVDRLTRVIADRGFTLFRVIDHSGQAAQAGVQMPESKLVMFGNPAKGAGVMLAAPVAGLDLPLKVLVWEDGYGAVSVSYNSPGFMAERHHLDGAHRAPFDAAQSIVEAVVSP